MSNEVRTTSSTGGQKGVKAQRLDLIPRKGLMAISEVFGFGAEKYADHNWRRGYEWSKSIAALDRHFSAYVDGETYDLCPEDCEFLSETGNRTCRNHSGLHHLAHAGFHVMVLLTWHQEQGEGVDNPFDDRWTHSMERARRKDREESAGDPEPTMSERVQSLIDQAVGLHKEYGNFYAFYQPVPRVPVTLTTEDYVRDPDLTITELIHRGLNI